ncbi:Aste57867_24534 [Aphanomyces stellatus]|uniref:Aste57867_24534 protein n=1 Tax=Aphanomyces stellatus TaxID=120398 RepID=A0A485LS94_9STRA|nr:hypothetical protein As57867_024457 [Aphanomyces stellatus]VFU01173.1 Aste57867_24534 [Aphanomyces stellatus]
MSKDMEIIVIGGGVVGLSTALVLLEQGFQRVKIVAADFEDTTSHVAGALWRPFSNAGTPDRIMEFANTMYMTLIRDVFARHGGAVVGVHEVPGTELRDVPEYDARPYWAHSVDGFRFLSSGEAAQYGKPHGFTYTTRIAHPGVLMAWMTQQIRARGGVLEKRFVSSLDEVTGDVIINCTGLGAGRLLHDANVYPVRGQVIKVFNPAIKQFFLVEAHGVYTYILPRPGGEVVLGGTTQANDWRTTNDDDDVQQILARCTALLPAVAASKLLYAKAGLRPATTHGTRVELDAKRTANGAWVIHNYGHGGSGHTIHRGCASDVAKIVQSLRAKL